MRRQVVTLAFGIAAALASFGCASDGEWSVRKLFGLNDPFHPSMDKYPKADYALNMRVEDLGKRIIEQNTFTGINPLFTTIGVPESVLFHRGPDELFISEGLVRQCKTEPELAAVMCSELGQMVAEKRAARRAGIDRDGIPEVAITGGATPSSGGGNPYDPGMQLQMAMADRRARTSTVANPVDAANQARLLLKGAGFDPAVLDQVQPMLKQSERGVKIQTQMSGTGPTPTWVP